MEKTALQNTYASTCEKVLCTGLELEKKWYRQQIKVVSLRQSHSSFKSEDGRSARNFSDTL